MKGSCTQVQLGLQGSSQADNSLRNKISAEPFFDISSMLNDSSTNTACASAVNENFWDCLRQFLTR